jgi:hypothetical protein
MFEYAFLSDPNNPVLEIFDIVLTTKDSGSVFTRDVVTSSAPEPGSGTPLFAGLALVGGIATGSSRFRQNKVPNRSRSSL